MKNLKVTKLSNGLKLATYKMNSAKTISFGSFIGSGSRQENIKNNGVAHFLEHMAFKGTKTRTSYDIGAEIENMGGYMNAYTSWEKTVFYAKLLSEDYKVGVDIVSDILINPSLDREELEKERGVILQEIAMYNDEPQEMAWSAFFETAYPDQPLGRSILGPKEIIENMTCDDLSDFINSHYHVDNMVLVAAGNLNHKELAEEAEKYFSGIRKSKKIDLEKSNYVGGEQFLEKEVEQGHIYYGFPVVSKNHEDYSKYKILSNILGEGMSSRIFQEVREKRGLAYSASSSVIGLSDCGIFYIHAGTSPDKVKEVKKISDDVLHSFVDSVTETELKRAKKTLLANFATMAESTYSIMNFIGSELLGKNKVTSYEKYSDEIQKITIEDVKEVHQKMLTTNPTVVFLNSK